MTTGARSEVGCDARARRSAKRAAASIAILGTLMLGAVERAEALTYRWINASGGNWFDAANWDVGQVPQNGGDVVLPDLGTSYVATLDQGPVNLDSFEIEHGVRFRMGHDFGSPALISSGLIRNAGEIFDASNLLRAPHVHNLAGATISLGPGPLYFDVDLLTNDGTITLGPGNAILEPGGNVEIEGTGEIVLTGDARIAPYYAYEPSPHLVQGAGHSIRGEDGAIDVPCDNHGAIEATGNFELASGSTNDGVLMVSSGSFRVTNLPNAGGEIFCEGGSLVGSLNNGGGDIEVTGGTLQANVTGNVLGTIRFSEPQGTLRGFIDNQGGTIVSTGDLTVQASNLVGGTIDVGGVLFTSTTTLSSVSFTSSTDVRVIGTTTVAGSSLAHDGTLTIAADLQFASPTTLSGAGEMVLDGGRLLGATVTNTAGHVIRGQGSILALLVNHGVVVADRADLPLKIAGTVNEDAVLRATGGATLRLEGSSIDNAGGTITAAAGGTFRVQSGEIRGGQIVGDGGNIAFLATGNILDETTLSVGAPSTMGNSGALTLDDVTLGSGVEFSNVGQVFVHGAGLTQSGTLTNPGTIDVAPGASLLGDGVLEMDGGRLQSTVAIVQAAGRAIRGNGTIAADFVNAGTLAPGTSPGTIVIEGDYQQQASGRLEIELAGTAPAAFDRLEVNGQATLDGTFAIAIDGGYAPAQGDAFEVMTFANRVGDFAAYEGLSPGGATIDPFYPNPGVALWLRVRQTGTTPVEGRPLPAALRFYAPRNGQRGELALELPGAAEVRIDVVDIGGRKMWSRSLTRDAGVHRVTVDDGLPAGVYFARASVRSANDVTERRARLIVVR